MWLFFLYHVLNGLKTFEIKLRVNSLVVVFPLLLYIIEFLIAFDGVELNFEVHLENPQQKKFVIDF